MGSTVWRISWLFYVSTVGIVKGTDIILRRGEVLYVSNQDDNINLDAIGTTGCAIEYDFDQRRVGLAAPALKPSTNCQTLLAALNIDSEIDDETIEVVLSTIGYTTFENQYYFPVVAVPSPAWEGANPVQQIRNAETLVLCKYKEASTIEITNSQIFLERDPLRKYSWSTEPNVTLIKYHLETDKTIQIEKLTTDQTDITCGQLYDSTTLGTLSTTERNSFLIEHGGIHMERRNFMPGLLLVDSTKANLVPSVVRLGSQSILMCLLNEGSDPKIQVSGSDHVYVKYPWQHILFDTIKSFMKIHVDKGAASQENMLKMTKLLEPEKESAICGKLLDEFSIDRGRTKLAYMKNLGALDHEGQAYIPFYVSYVAPIDESSEVQEALDASTTIVYCGMPLQSINDIIKLVETDQGSIDVYDGIDMPFDFSAMAPTTAAKQFKMDSNSIIPKIIMKDILSVDEPLLWDPCQRLYSVDLTYVDATTRKHMFTNSGCKVGTDDQVLCPGYIFKNSAWIITSVTPAELIDEASTTIYCAVEFQNMSDLDEIPAGNMNTDITAEIFIDQASDDKLNVLSKGTGGELAIVSVVMDQGIIIAHKIKTDTIVGKCNDVYPDGTDLTAVGEFPWIYHAVGGKYVPDQTTAGTGKIYFPAFISKTTTEIGDGLNDMETLLTDPTVKAVWCWQGTGASAPDPPTPIAVTPNSRTFANSNIAKYSFSGLDPGAELVKISVVFSGSTVDFDAAKITDKTTFTGSCQDLIDLSAIRSLNDWTLAKLFSNIKGVIKDDVGMFFPGFVAKSTPYDSNATGADYITDADTVVYCFVEGPNNSLPVFVESGSTVFMNEPIKEYILDNIDTTTETAISISYFKSNEPSDISIQQTNRFLTARDRCIFHYDSDIMSFLRPKFMARLYHRYGGILNDEDQRCYLPAHIVAGNANLGHGVVVSDLIGDATTKIYCPLALDQEPAAPQAATIVTAASNTINASTPDIEYDFSSLADPYMIIKIRIYPSDTGSEIVPISYAAPKELAVTCSDIYDGPRIGRLPADEWNRLNDQLGVTVAGSDNQPYFIGIMAKSGPFTDSTDISTSIDEATIKIYCPVPKTIEIVNLPGGVPDGGTDSGDHQPAPQPQPGTNASGAILIGPSKAINSQDQEQTYTFGRIASALKAARVSFTTSANTEPVVEIAEIVHTENYDFKCSQVYATDIITALTPAQWTALFAAVQGFEEGGNVYLPAFFTFVPRSRQIDLSGLNSPASVLNCKIEGKQVPSSIAYATANIPTGEQFIGSMDEIIPVNRLDSTTKILSIQYTIKAGPYRADIGIVDTDERHIMTCRTIAGRSAAFSVLSGNQLEMVYQKFDGKYKVIAGQGGMIYLPVLITMPPDTDPPSDIKDMISTGTIKYYCPVKRSQAEPAGLTTVAVAATTKVDADDKNTIYSMSGLASTFKAGSVVWHSRRPPVIPTVGSKMFAALANAIGSCKDIYGDVNFSQMAEDLFASYYHALGGKATNVANNKKLYLPGLFAKDNGFGNVTGLKEMVAAADTVVYCYAKDASIEPTVPTSPINVINQVTQVFRNLRPKSIISGDIVFEDDENVIYSKLSATNGGDQIHRLEYKLDGVNKAASYISDLPTSSMNMKSSMFTPESSCNELFDDTGASLLTNEVMNKLKEDLMIVENNGKRYLPLFVGSKAGYPIAGNPLSGLDNSDTAVYCFIGNSDASTEIFDIDDEIKAESSSTVYDYSSIVAPSAGKTLVKISYAQTATGVPRPVEIPSGAKNSISCSELIPRDQSGAISGQVMYQFATIVPPSSAGKPSKIFLPALIASDSLPTADILLTAIKNATTSLYCLVKVEMSPPPLVTVSRNMIYKENYFLRPYTFTGVASSLVLARVLYDRGKRDALRTSIEAITEDKSTFQTSCGKEFDRDTSEIHESDSAELDTTVRNFGAETPKIDYITRVILVPAATLSNTSNDITSILRDAPIKLMCPVRYKVPTQTIASSTREIHQYLPPKKTTYCTDATRFYLDGSELPNAYLIDYTNDGISYQLLPSPSLIQNVDTFSIQCTEVFGENSNIRTIIDYQTSQEFDRTISDGMGYTDTTTRGRFLPVVISLQTRAREPLELSDLVSQAESSLYCAVSPPKSYSSTTNGILEDTMSMVVLVLIGATSLVILGIH